MTLVAVALLPFLSPPALVTRELVRGMEIETLSVGAPGPRYWEVDDTTLVAARPDVNFGGNSTLQGGPGKRILIRFAGLGRALGPNVEIQDARLVLTQFGPGAPRNVAVGRMLVPWGEGPRLVLGANVTPHWGSTWSQRRAGHVPANWQRPGATGPADVEALEGVRLEYDPNGVVTLTGLGPAVQRMADNDSTNHGFVLEFDTQIDFFSSEAGRQDRPRLVVEYREIDAPRGPDLSVVSIERVPEYPRLVTTPTSVQSQDGLAIPGPGVAEDVKRWPITGEEVEYIATIKNVGNAPANGFLARWTRGEVRLSGINIERKLEPGESIQLRTAYPFPEDLGDHRVHVLGMTIEPRGEDAYAGNNHREIAVLGLAVGVIVEEGYLRRFGEAANVAGTRSFEDWMQAQVALWNDVYLARSTFSFAPYGALERFRIQRFEVVPDGTLAGRAPDTRYDVEARFAADARIERGLDLDLLRDLSRQYGLVDFGPMRIDPDRPLGRTNEGDGPRRRGSLDRFAGLMGGGDTREETAIPNMVPLDDEPTFDPLLMAARLEPMGLYSMTDVAIINARVGRRAGDSGAGLYGVPEIVSVRALDAFGRPMAQTRLDFFQLAGDDFVTEPTFSLTTNDSGSVTLPSREILEPEIVRSASGPRLQPNPFGRIDREGRNGVFRVRTERDGRVSYAFLKIWRLVDSVARSGRTASTTDLRFDWSPFPIDLSRNFAAGALARDSEGSGPELLTSLTNGNFTQGVLLGGEPGAWVEIDLGRDRNLGLVRLTFTEATFWSDFEILVYQTGESEFDALTVWRETNTAWSRWNRPDSRVGEPDRLAYYLIPERARFIRLVNRGNQAGVLAEIEVFGAVESGLPE